MKSNAPRASPSTVIAAPRSVSALTSNTPTGGRSRREALNWRMSIRVSTPPRHVQVQGHQVGGRIPDKADRLLAAPHGAHHADARVPLQRPLQGRAEDARVVDDQDPQRFGIHAFVVSSVVTLNRPINPRSL